jgi:pimeloyl-ACP methyl ester carboxylesterase
VLPDSRALAYAEYGAPDGIPFIFMHGIPSSRLAGGLIDEAARRRGVHVIAPDRPGYGYSAEQPGRTILDWPRDVANLADQLDLGRFGVLGISGAVPYLLACAVAMPDRLSHVAILSGLGPLRAPGVMAGMNRESAALYRIALRSPRLGRMWMKMLAQTAKRSPLAVYQRQLSYLPEADRAVFDRPEMRELRIADLAEAFRQGSNGPAQEAVLHVSDWGFELGDVPVEVFLWQGAKDRHHPMAMGRYLSQAIPRNRAVVVDDVGAFGFISQMESIFDELMDCPVDFPSSEPVADAVPASASGTRVSSLLVNL